MYLLSEIRLWFSSSQNEYLILCCLISLQALLVGVSDKRNQNRFRKDLGKNVYQFLAAWWYSGKGLT